MTELLVIAGQSPTGEIIAFLLGLIWGSFFNVCIYRLPMELTVVRGGSFCPHCHKAVRPQHNIPVISYLLLRGRCAYCQGKISIEYPIVEILSGLLFLLIFLNFGWSVEFLAFSIFLSALFVASVIDLHHQIIPDEISLSGIVVGFLASFILPELDWRESLGGILFGGGSFFMVAFLYEKIAKREGLGGGDVKLLGMIGAWLGYQSILPVILISSGLGSVIGIAVMMAKGRGFKTAIPFGPFLSAGAFVMVFWGKPLTRAIFPDLPLMWY